MSCYGATKVQTPSIDKLALEGRRFTDAHSASAVCTPSRYGLLTGQYPFRGNSGKGIWGPCSHTQPLLIDTDKLTLAQLLKNDGYATAADLTQTTNVHDLYLGKVQEMRSLLNEDRSDKWFGKKRKHCLIAQLQLNSLE